MPKAVSHKLLVGLEIHVQLATKSKMFTAAANGFGTEANSQVDPQVLGLPGTLPVMNKKAVEYSIKAGLALGCKIAEHTKWDRKSYYYPDLPKNYQISQYDLPLCYEGSFDLEMEDGSVRPIRIRRAHLEEDAGKLLHEAPGGYHIDWSIVDLNRAGTPLLEIVTEPDFSEPKEVAAFGQALQKLVQFMGISEGQMQLGHMRFEPNINVHITGDDGKIYKTAITEIKNLNSFSVLEKATAYEALRQVAQWERDGSLGKKSTYGWDDVKQQTFHQRDKEEANDYRYFPDPDLMPVEVNQAWLTELKAQVGELPAARRKRYLNDLKLAEKEANLLSSDKAIGDFFEASTALGVEPKRALSLIEALREMANETPGRRATDFVMPQHVAATAELVTTGKIAASKEIAKQLFTKLAAGGPAAGNSADVEAAATELGLIQSTDTGPVDAAIDALIEQNPKSLQDYQGGKASALGALTGMVMKNGKGFNAKVVQERLKAKLG